MIQLLFMVLLAEAAVASLLMLNFEPLRELVMKGLDQLKTGKGHVTVKTIAATVALILAASIKSALQIQNKGDKVGTLTPMDQVLWRTHLLEATLTGCILFLVFVIDQIHEYLQNLIGLRSTVEASEQEAEMLKKENLQLKEKNSKEIKSLKEEISNLTESLKKLKLESEEKDQRVLSAEAHVVALQKQSEDLLLEYDRLLDQTLQGQTANYRG